MKEQYENKNWLANVSSYNAEEEKTDAAILKTMEVLRQQVRRRADQAARRYQAKILYARELKQKGDVDAARNWQQLAVKVLDTAMDFQGSTQDHQARSVEAMILKIFLTRAAL